MFNSRVHGWKEHKKLHRMRYFDAFPSMLPLTLISFSLIEMWGDRTIQSVNTHFSSTMTVIVIEPDRAQNSLQHGMLWDYQNTKTEQDLHKFSYIIGNWPILSQNMDNQYFISWYHHWQKNLIWNFENSTPDSDSPYPIAFDQTIGQNGISSVGTTIDEKKTNFKLWKSEDGFGLPVVDILRLEHFQTLKISTYYLLRSLFVRPFARNLYADSNSPASITQRPTMFELSMVHNC